MNPWFLLGKTLLNTLLIPVAMVRDFVTIPAEDVGAVAPYTRRQLQRVERDGLKLLDELFP